MCEICDDRADEDDNRDYCNGDPDSCDCMACLYGPRDTDAPLTAAQRAGARAIADQTAPY
jgi:hypothetical protein